MTQYTHGRCSDRQCSVRQRNCCRHTRLVPDDACCMPTTREILCQGHMPRAKPMHGAISQADFYLPSEIDDVLPPWGIVPVRKTARLCGPKDNPGCGLQRR